MFFIVGPIGVPNADVIGSLTSDFPLRCTLAIRSLAPRTRSSTLSTREPYMLTALSNDRNLLLLQIGKNSVNGFEIPLD